MSDKVNEKGEKASMYIEMATALCSTRGIHVAFEEVWPGSDDLGACLVHGTGIILPTAPRAISAGDHGQGGTEFSGQRHCPHSAGAERAIARASSVRYCGTNRVKNMGHKPASGGVGLGITGVKRAASGVTEVGRPKKAPRNEEVPLTKD